MLRHYGPSVFKFATDTVVTSDGNQAIACIEPAAVRYIKLSIYADKWEMESCVLLS